MSQRPDDWTPKAPNKAAGEPELAAIDKPGEWDMYTYRPRFCSKAKKDFKKGQYTHHALPTGARPVPADDTGSRQKAGWEFHYQKWTNEDGPKFRSGATRTNPFPDSRKGHLDYDLLKKMGLTNDRLLKHDSLFLAASFPHL